MPVALPDHQLIGLDQTLLFHILSATKTGNKSPSDQDRGRQLDSSNWNLVGKCLNGHGCTLGISSENVSMVTVARWEDGLFIF